MKTNKNKPELLAPAGSLEKMKIALEFSADAVYFGLPDFSLRARINKFGKREIKKGAELCHKLGKKFYVTINIYAHNEHIKKLPEHLKFINEIKPDAVILSDPGVLHIIKKECPKIPIHLSTQANATNIEAVKFWQEQGVERIILARELSVEEIKEIKKAVPEMEMEVFVHGAMCMAYSGRCILSKWMTHAPSGAGQAHAGRSPKPYGLGRSANLGDCAQPCRWGYKKIQNPKFEIRNKFKIEKNKFKTENTGLNNHSKTSIIDDKSRFMMDLEEDQHGTYFFNSYDICLIEYLNKLIEAGIDSFKIEGRGKSVYYVAVVTRAYRKAIDSLSCSECRSAFTTVAKEQKKELEKLSHRGYWTGFVLGDEPPHLTEEAYKKTDWEFVGISHDNKKTDERSVFIHNQISAGDNVEIITPNKNVKTKVEKITNEKDEVVKSAHGGQGKIFKIKFSKPMESVCLLRKKMN